MAFSNQSSGAEYVSSFKLIPPGRQTGVYYIPVGNLPWNTSWTTLKDFVRTVCEVDHVEIFQESTTGWVRVLGKTNFEAALDLLNGGILDGRALIADGRNAKRPIMLRDLKVPPPESSIGRPTTQWTNHSGPHSAQSDSFQYSQELSLASLTLSPCPATYRSEYASAPVSYPQAYSAQYAAPQALPAACATCPYPQAPEVSYGESSYASRGYAGKAHGSSPQGSAWYYYPGSTPTADYNSSSNTGFGQYPPPPLVKTEQRRIFMRNLVYGLTRGEIHEIVASFVSAEAAAQILNIDIDVRRGKSDSKRSRGCALVLFRTEGAARDAVSCLDGAEVRGRRVQVRFADSVTVRVATGGGSKPLLASPSSPATPAYQDALLEDGGDQETTEGLDDGSEDSWLDLGASQRGYYSDHHHKDGHKKSWKGKEKEVEGRSYAASSPGSSVSSSTAGGALIAVSSSSSASSSHSAPTSSVRKHGHKDKDRSSKATGSVVIADGTSPKIASQKRDKKHRRS